jgi:hypothetical protein
VRVNPCPLTPVVNEAPTVVVGLTLPFLSLFVPSKVKCATLFAAATSLELLYPPIGGRASSSFLLQETITRRRKREKMENKLITFFIDAVLIIKNSE